MKVITKGKGYVLEFTCECCGSVLVAEPDEMSRRLGDDIYHYNCPVCEEKRSIHESKITKKYLH